VKASSDKNICAASDTVNIVNISNGLKPFNISWSTGDTSSTAFVKSGTSPQNIRVVIIDSNLCRAIDTVVVGVFQPKIFITAPSKTCYNQPFGTKAVLSGAINPTYEWVGYSKNNLFLVDTPTVSKNYTFSLVDSFGCKADTSFFVTVLNPQVNISSKNKYCINDTIQLIANISGGQAPIKATWQPSGIIGDSLTIYPKHSAGSFTISVKIKDGFRCEDSAFKNITVNALPNITLTPSGPYCETRNTVNFTVKGSPIGGVWFGQGIINDSTFSPQAALLGVNKIGYLYRDTATGCMDTSTMQVTVVRHQKASFVALKTIGLPNDTIDFINSTPNASSLSNRWDMGDFGKTNNIQLTTNASYKYADTGKYTVKLWVKNTICPPDSLTKTNYIKIGSYYLSSKSVSKRVVKLYPNPASKSITIEADEDIVQIDIYDVLGRRYKIESTNNSTKIEINIQHLPTGIYVIMTKDIEGNSYTNKVQITR